MRGPIVFLHIPKTAGQTVFHQLASRVGIENTSPIRDIVQAGQGETHLPQGYRFYGGHIDWTDIDTLADPFVFTILRDPRERIGSLYAYLLREARSRTPEEIVLPRYTGQRVMLERTVDDYFFGGDRRWQRFIQNNYDNYACNYLATRKVRGFAEMAGLATPARVEAAMRNAARLSAIYDVGDLGPLEADMAARLGAPVRLVGNHNNVGEKAVNGSRWDALIARFESDGAARRLEAFVEADLALRARLGMRDTVPEPGPALQPPR
ncbi:sulfotransferase family 2 domain-containing protein [Acuticoccus kandeliae]|uniref:sulfotransferase family 2 domain-containing protein n=1 Tax=Acuticoccus kandeliae TaxID=2073160 RepID=UPI001300A294|nr:sulfotransferase family 2 domain-containing protein [Acuticoccus kandeliae]